MGRIIVYDGEVPVSAYLDRANAIATASSRSFNNLSFGTASSRRYLVACLGWFDTGDTTVGSSSVTIGGVTATKLAEQVDAEEVASAIYCALVPTGTTGTVTINLSGSNAADAFTVSLFSLTGWAGVYYNAGNGDGNDPMVFSTNARAYSEVIAGAVAINTFGDDPVVNFTWSGLTEVQDNHFGGTSGGIIGYSSARQSITTTETPLSASVNPRHTGQNRASNIVVFYN